LSFINLTGKYYSTFENLFLWARSMIVSYAIFPSSLWFQVSVFSPAAGQKTASLIKEKKL